MKMNIAEIAKAVDAQNDIEQWPDIEVSGVAFDSRNLKAGNLFVPLMGARDGHEFVNMAFENGASATLWQADHDYDDDGHPRIVVDDPLKALQKLGKYYLHKINPLVVAVSGSNGKTTTKDMIASILSTQMNVIKTHANFNNSIGVPVTLLNMESNTEAVVVEMGMSHFGELDELSKLVTPDIAVLTMIGEAHIEFFGTRDRIADAKMEITHGLTEDGFFVYNGDEPLLRTRAKQVQQVQKTFGRQLNNDIYATSVHQTDDSITFRVNMWPDEEFTIPMIGEYNVNNAMAAMMVGHLMHVTPDHIKKGLAKVNLTANRAEWLKGNQGEKILSDVYNSNPTAVKEVLETLKELPENGRRIIVLGDMLELGDASEKLHAGLAAEIDHDHFQKVFLVGPQMKALEKQLLTDGYPADDLKHFATDELDQVVASLKDTIEPGDIVLLKGSHGIHLENVLKELKAE